MRQSSRWWPWPAVTPAPGHWLLSQGIALGISAFELGRVAVGIDTAMWRLVGWIDGCGAAKPSPASPASPQPPVHDVVPDLSPPIFVSAPSSKNNNTTQIQMV